MTDSHTPIMVNEILDFMGARPQPMVDYCDATFGRGGHVQSVVERFPEVRVAAVDRDLQAIEAGKEKFSSLVKKGQLQFFHCNFSEMKETLPVDWKFDAILADLGVSSPQLDQGSRGFSFYHEGPLDMRMDTTQPVTAADIVNTVEADELTEIFRDYGEVRRPFRVVRAIVHDRKEKKFTSTRQLAELIERVDGWRQKGSHPATRYFLGLRLYVNQELQSVKQGLPVFLDRLKPQGLLMVISFHSLEDRIVKRQFRAWKEHGTILTKKVVWPQEAETKENPRARSARLRVFEKGVSSYE